MSSVRLNALNEEPVKLKYPTDRELVEELSSSHPQLSEYVAIKEWLETTCQTLLVTQDHSQTYASKTSFQLMRRGQMDKMLNYCRQLDQHWRAVSMLGGVYFGSTKTMDDHEDSDRLAMPGNRNRGLWRMCCFQLANDSSLDMHERAQYAMLCGNTANILPVCETYEDFLWAYFTSLVINTTEQLLREYPRIHGADYHEFSIPDIDVSTPSDVFQKLSHIPDSVVSDHPAKLMFRKVQASLILNQWEGFFEELLDTLDTLDVGLHRFMVHLMSMFRDAGMPLEQDDEQVFDAVCGSYVDVLIKNQLNSLVPVYTCRLPYTLQLQKYALYLADMDADLNDRSQVLKLAHNYGMDVRQITITAFVCCFERGSNIEFNSLCHINEQVSESDQRLIKALMWLMMERDQSQDALLYCNELYRRFWLQGKLNAANLLRQTLQQDSMFGSQVFVDNLRAQFGDTVLENFIREQVYHALFLEAMLRWEEWRLCFDAKPHVSAPSQLKTWSAEITKLTSQVEELFTDLLGTSGDLSWLQDDEEVYPTTMPQGFNAEARQDELQQLCRIYIPEIVMMLHQCLYATRDIIADNTHESLELVKHAANSNRQLFRDFLEPDMSCGPRMQEFLSAVAESCLEQLDKNGSVF